MSEVVIAAIGRTPIGRAVKGSLIDHRPDDLGAFVVDEVLKQIPQLDRAQIDDVICGCALPGGEQGHNLGRIITLLNGLRTRDQAIGLETMCVGGGQGMAMIVERLS